MGFDFSGLDDLFGKIESASSDVDVPLRELFNDDFMSQHTKFTSFTEFCTGLDIKTSDDLKTIPAEKMNSYVATNSDFNSWQELQSTAAQQYIVNSIRNSIQD